eukprot:scaffold7352_cov254-Pinguiococcus_pyrenoidosus.AAC.33
MASPEASKKCRSSTPTHASGGSGQCLRRVATRPYCRLRSKASSASGNCRPDTYPSRSKPSTSARGSSFRASRVFDIGHSVSYFRSGHEEPANTAILRVRRADAGAPAPGPPGCALALPVRISLTEQKVLHKLVLLGEARPAGVAFQTRMFLLLRERFQRLGSQEASLSAHRRRQALLPTGQETCSQATIRRVRVPRGKGPDAHAA